MTARTRYGVVVVVWLWMVTRALAVLQLAPSSDIDRYFAIADAWLAGRLPYVDVPFEYPPGALLLALFPRLAASSVTTYGYAFAAFILVFDVLNVWLVARMARERAVAAALLYVAAGALLGEVLVQRLDAPVATSIILALAWARRSPASKAASHGVPRAHRWRAELAVAAGVVLKLVPIVILPATWIARASSPRAIARSLVLTLAMVGAAFAPFVALAGTHAVDFLGYHGGRGIQIESVPATVLLLLRAAGLIELRAVFDYGAMHLVGDGTTLARVLSTIALPLMLTGALLIVVRRRDSDRERAAFIAAAAILLALLLGAKVLSPQFVTWLLPPLCVLAARDDRPRGLAAGVLLTALLTGFIAKFAYRPLVEMNAVAVILLLLRNALLLWLLFSVTRWRRLQRPALLTVPLARLCIGAALLVLIIVANARDVDSSDFWLHRRIGEDILHTLTIPRVDSYAATTMGARFVAHEWLAGVLLHLVNAAGGSAALVMLRIALVIVIVAAGIAAVPRVLRGHPAAAPVALAAIAIIHARTEVRPHLFALACLALLLWAVGGLRRCTAGTWRAYAGIALLHVVWANMHASVFLGVALLALHAAVEHLGGTTASRARARAFAAGAAVALAASFVNPRGPSLFAFAVTTSSSPALRDFVHEWRPLWAVWSPGANFLCFAVFLALLLAGAPLLRRSRRFRAPMLAAFALMALAVYANRFQAEVALVGGPVVLAALARAWRVIPLRFAAGTLAPVACIVLLLLFVGLSPLGTGYGKVPSVAVAALARTGLKGAVINEYNDGGYLISELPSGLRPVMDGRFDVHGEDRFRAWEAAWASPDALAHYADVHGAIAVLINAKDGGLLRALRHDRRWRVQAEDDLRVLFVRALARGTDETFPVDRHPDSR